MPSFKVMVQIPGEKPSENALRFASHKEADQYGFDLLCRWFVPEGYAVEESEDPVNYRWVEGTGAERVQEEVS